MKHIALLLLMVSTISGCASISTLKPGGGASFEVRQKSYNDVWKAAVEVVTRSLTIVENDKLSGVIKAEARAGLTTWGEVVGVFISPSKDGADFYRVEVVSEKRVQTQITGQNWEQTIVAGMKAELGL